ncbi:hypothetical protein ACIQ1J_11575 [Streptomyces sp. NPDC097107]|uniref:hypothetical protein n=1 Tax=Streptomyces sp. NPDC097107 TaxID=3366089 RepID=UPI003828CCBE
MPYGARPYAPPRADGPEFTVLLGPDYSGKSSVLRRLADSGHWTVVTCDQTPLDTDYALIGRARRELLSEALRAPAGRYSPDILITLLQLAVVHMRDRVTGAPPGRPPNRAPASTVPSTPSCTRRGIGPVSDMEAELFPAYRGRVLAERDGLRKALGDVRAAQDGALRHLLSANAAGRPAGGPTWIPTGSPPRCCADTSGCRCAP